MSTAPRYIPHYTIEDYRHWEGAWELIDGIPIAMSPSPFGPHERIVTELSRQISNQLIENNCQCRVYANLDWTISDDTMVRPDLMVVCGQQPERHLDHAPDLAVEVSSESTRQHDLTVKRALYLENHVAHYLVVDPSAHNLLLASSDGEISFGQGETIPLTLGKDLCAVEIQCERLFE